jgi:vacuolar protein sorting-associated protein 45
MDISQAAAGYITKMVSVGDSSSGTQGARMKILLLDRDTVGIPLAQYLADCVGSHRFYCNDTVGPAEP